MNLGEKQIIQLYVGMLGRAPDPAGLAYWIGRAADGMSVLEIAGSFAVQPEYQSTYGGLSHDQLLDKIYASLFDRMPDAQGKAYWLNELANGKPVSRLIVDVMSGAQGADKIAIENTAIVAKDWTNSTASRPFDIAAAQNAIESIGKVEGDGVTVTFGSGVLQPYEAFLTNAMAAAWTQWGNHGMLDVQLNFVKLSGGTIAFAYARNELLTGEMGLNGTAPITQSNVGIEVNTGMDMNGDLPDITITIAMSIFNFLQYDAPTVFAHEIGHGLGFRTELFDFDPRDGGTATSWDIALSFPTGTSGSARFNGQEAVAVYGGPVPITGYYNATHPLEGVPSVMVPTIGVGVIRSVTALDFAMAHDIGVMV